MGGERKELALGERMAGGLRGTHLSGKGVFQSPFFVLGVGLGFSWVGGGGGGWVFPMGTKRVCIGGKGVQKPCNQQSVRLIQNIRMGESCSG